MWAARAVLALLIAGPYFLLTVAAPLIGNHAYLARITMSVPSAGIGQLFFDLGSGFREEDSSRVPVAPGMHRYEFPIPLGTLSALRLDPGLTGGRYIIREAEILRPDGAPYAPLSLQALLHLNQLQIATADTTDLVLDSPRDSRDPYVVFRLPAPVPLAPLPYTTAALVGRLLASWLIAFLAIVTCERFGWGLGSRVAAARRWWQSAALPPAVVLLGVAVIATSIATYPLLLANRSLVSPANGPVAMLYDHPPFVPGSEDYGLEDTRGSDVGAGMWAFVPYSKIQRDALAQGSWPLWNRYNGAGRPLWGQGQSLILDPLHWLTLVGADPAPGWDLKFVAHRLVFSFGIGMAALLATGSLAPAAMAAALAPFAGLYVFRFNHAAAFAPTYAPWILMAWFLMGAASDRQARGRAALLLALASALTLVASPPKEGIMMLVGSHLIGALALAWARPALGHTVAGFLAAGVAGLIALLVSAPHWLVFLDTLRQAKTLSDTPVVHLATRDSALGFALGNLTPATLQPGLHLVPVALAITALAAPTYLWAHRALSACAVGALGLTAAAFGVLPPTWLLQVPLVRNIGHVGDTVMTALMVPTLILAAGGVQVLSQTSRVTRALQVTALAAAASILLYQTGWLTGFERFDQWLIMWVLSVAVCFPLTIAAAYHHQDRALPLICVAAAFAVPSALGGLHLQTGVAAIDRLLPQPSARVSLDMNSPATERARVSQPAPTRVIGLDLLLFQGSQALYELESIGGPDALMLGAYEEMLEAGGVAREWGWMTLVNPDQLDRLGPLLDLLNVGLVVTRQNQVPAGLTKGDEDPDPWIDVASRPTAWPRAYFVDGIRKYTTPVELLQLVREQRKPLAGVRADDSEGLRLTAHLPGREHTVSFASDYALTTNSTRFRIRATGPGVAVLTESYVDLDFRASLNGEAVPYFRVNHAFKGVAIPGAGVWDVAFEYRPVHWGGAWAIAGFGMLLMVVVSAASFPRRPRRAHPVR